MSVNVNQLLHSTSSASTVVVEAKLTPAKDELGGAEIVVVSGPLGEGGGGGSTGGGRKRKRHSGNGNRSMQNNFNNSKRQKNKQQNIIICGGGGAGSKLPIPSGGPTSATKTTSTTAAPANIGNANNSLGMAAAATTAPAANNCSKSNAENYGGNTMNNNNNNGGGGRNKNFYHKIHFRHLNGGRSRRLQLFPALSKFFLPDKRPRKEIIVPPTKFLLGGNISDPLNLNSLQDDNIEASPKSSPMMTPPKVEVIIPPNIRDPLHLLDPVDSIEYEKQLTSPMKKMMGLGGGGKKNRNHKKKNRSGGGRNSFQKEQRMSSSFQEGAETSGPVAGLVEGGSADGCTTNASEAVRTKEEILEDKEGGAGEISLGQGVRESVLQLELSVDVDLPERKRRISESSTQTGAGGSKLKIRRMDSIVSPVIPQPGAHKRPIPMGPQGAPGRNRSRTHSVQSTDNDELKGVTATLEEANESLKAEAREELEANKSTDSIKSSVGSSGKPDTGDAIKVVRPDGDLEEVTGQTANTEKATDRKNTKKKNKNTVFQFGNYDRYYGYRNLNEMMDVRLQVFQQNEFLFKDKDVLDIGCNVGHLTTAVAKNFSPRSVLGVDIDSKLIRRARQNLSLFVRVPPSATEVSGEAVAGPSTTDEVAGGDQGVAKLADKSTNRKRRRGKNSVDTNKKFAEFFPQSFPLCYGLIPDVRTLASTPSAAVATASAAASAGASSTTPTSAGGLLVATGPKSTDDQDQQQHKKKDYVPPAKILFPNNIRFLAGNYVLKSEHQLAHDERHKYDLIMCLSVTKWVHLNYGDMGLKLMFRRIFNQLRPGGKFILEAQNWASYKKKKKLTVSGNEGNGFNAN